MSYTGSATFQNNTGRFGGAIDVSYNSSISLASLGETALWGTSRTTVSAQLRCSLSPAFRGTNTICRLSTTTSPPLFHLEALSSPGTDRVFPGSARIRISWEIMQVLVGPSKVPGHLIWGIVLPSRRTRFLSRKHDIYRQP